MVERYFQQQGESMAHDASQYFSQQALLLTRIVGKKRLYFLCKRCMDIVLSVLFLTFTLPLLLLVAVLDKLDSPGPVLFNQERLKPRKRSIGGGERREPGTFIIHKSRTRYHNSNPSMHQQFTKALILNTPRNSTVTLPQVLTMSCDTFSRPIMAPSSQLAGG